MQPAVGEANKTLITIILIAIVAATGVILVPRMMNQTSKNHCCEDIGGVVVNNNCYEPGACKITGSGKLECEEDGKIDDVCKVKSSQKCIEYDGGTPVLKDC